MANKNYNALSRYRCDHCGKWVGECELYTFDPEDEEYLELKTCDEFLRCKKCCNNKDYTLSYWKDWIKNKREVVEKEGKDLFKVAICNLLYCQ